MAPVMADRVQRQYPRYALEATVDVMCGDGQVTARSKNLSAGGLCADSDEAVATGSEVTLRITLIFDEDTFSEPLELPARVAWCTALGSTHQLGFQFLKLSDETRSYLQMFLRFLDDREEADSANESTNDPFDS